jgi:hypothetical protein
LEKGETHKQAYGFSTGIGEACPTRDGLDALSDADEEDVEKDTDGTHSGAEASAAESPLAARAYIPMQERAGGDTKI